MQSARGDERREPFEVFRHPRCAIAVEMIDLLDLQEERGEEEALELCASARMRVRGIPRVV